MLPLSLDKIDEALLLELCDEGCPESQTLEFKRELPGKLEQDKHEVCKDVVALANAEGGDRCVESAADAWLAKPPAAERRHPPRTEVAGNGRSVAVKPEVIKMFLWKKYMIIYHINYSLKKYFQFLK